MDTHRIVIAGAGFGGVRAALKLAKHKHFDITVISDKSTFRYYPALYETATGHDSNESTIPLKEMFLGHKNLIFTKDRLLKIDVAGKRIKGEHGGWYQYDSLIIALGTVTNYFGINGLDKFSFGIKSEDEINKLKDHLHSSLATQKQLDANYVVVGGGPTGVELSAALNEYISQIAHHHEVENQTVKVSLVEAMDRILPKMSPRASQKVHKRLAELGVNIMTSSKVENETADILTVNGEPLTTRTVIWTSGIANSSFFDANKSQFKFIGNGKVQVDDFLQGAPSVYVIGDNAATPFSGLAQTALYDADFVVKNINRQIKNQRPKKYRPKKQPVVVPAGKRWAIVEWGPFVFGGVLGSLLREAADFIGYYDILPLKAAIRVWLSGARKEEKCPVCEEKSAKVW